MTNLKLIINGSFRSGTSILWEVVKRSNPDMVCFYEPCHPDLLPLLKEHPKGRVNPLHGMVVFDEYHDNFSDLTIFDDSLSRTKVLPESIEPVMERIARFELLGKPYILQANRWHLHLGELSRHYACPVLQLVRNPYRVWDSIQRGIRNQGKLSYQIRRFLVNRSLGDFFGSNRIYEICSRHAAIKPPRFSTSFERFIVGWLLSNDRAVQSALRTGGEILLYEDLCRSGGKVLKDLNLGGVRFDASGIIRQKASVFLNDSELRKLRSIARKYGVSGKLDRLLECLDSRTV